MQKAVKVKQVSKQQCLRLQYTTFNLFTIEEEEKIYKDLDCKYLTTCDEICPTTKRNHQHGYIELNKKKQFNIIFDYLKQYDNGVHIEICKGKQSDNIKYIRKNGVYREYGESKKQGQRTDITTSLYRNKNLKEFIQNEPALYVRYRSGIEGYYRTLVGSDYIPNDDKPIVIWLYGDSGTGKSRTIKHYIKTKIRDGYRCWRAPLCNKNGWFDGYAGQDLVYIDELRYNTYDFNDLLQLLDYDTPQVPVKGFFVDFNPKVILITSNQHPSQTYEYINDENKYQLVRRIDYIYEITSYNPSLLL